MIYLFVNFATPGTNLAQRFLQRDRERRWRGRVKGGDKEGWERKEGGDREWRGREEKREGERRGGDREGRVRKEGGDREWRGREEKREGERREEEDDSEGRRREE